MDTFVFGAMGTTVSILTPAPLPDAVRGGVRDAFEHLEARFSLWRPDAEGARFARRELRLTEASAEFRAVYDQAIEWRRRTEGAFTPHRPDGQVDLSGIVKALGIQASADCLDAHGVPAWCINAGGDVLVRGAQADGTPWVVGVVDPDDRTQLLSQFATRPGRLAVATSGLAERGDHVWRLGADATFTQVTVCAADIVTADVLATAILAGGPGILEAMQDAFDIDVLAAAADGGGYRATSVFLA